jgi:ADP-ribose pyrophosphatase YjhB (NUDIX family)
LKVVFGGLSFGSQTSYLKYVTCIGNNTRDPRGFCLTNIFVVNGGLTKIPSGVRAGDDAVDYTWFSIYELPEMAFDHKQIVDKILHIQRDTCKDKSYKTGLSHNVTNCVFVSFTSI